MAPCDAAAFFVPSVACMCLLVGGMAVDGNVEGYGVSVPCPYQQSTTHTTISARISV